MLRSTSHHIRFVFDLDDTLYAERDYVRSGFEAVGAYVVERLGIRGFGEQCWALFTSGERGRIFNQALNACSHSSEPVLIDQLVHVYRSHQPAIQLYPDASRFLRHAVKMGLELGLITDGPKESQRAKIDALHLRQTLSSIVITDELGSNKSKPHPAAFENIQRLLVPGQHFVYVADNPVKDFLAPNRLGWTTIRVLRDDGIYGRSTPPSAIHASQSVIHSLDELVSLVRDIEKPRR